MKVIDKLATLPPLAWTLAIGTVGGAVAAWISMPLAWMVGAMVLVTIAALASVPLRLPRQLRGAMVAVLGVMLGSAFTPAILGKLDRWLVSLLFLLPYCLVVGGLLWWLFRRFARYDNATAFFSAVPGGFQEMLLIGHAMGGDDRTLALAHSARILFTVLSIPFWFRITEGYTGGGSFAGPNQTWAALDIVILAGCAVLGNVIGRRIRLPAAEMTGPMLFSAAAHLLELTGSSPPGLLIAAAQVVIGCSIGTRFTGVRPRVILHSLGISAVATVPMLAITVLFGWLAHLATGLPTEILVLAYAPGGLAEMSLVALWLGADTAAVTGHHIVRIIIVIGLAPVIYRMFIHKPPP